MSLFLVISSLLAIAFASPTCSQGTCKDDEVSLLQTQTKIKKHDEAAKSDEDQDEENESDEDQGEKIGDKWFWSRRRRTPPPPPPPPPPQPPRDKFADIKNSEKTWTDAIKLTLILKSGRNLKDTDGLFRGASDPWCKIKIKCDGCLGNKDYTEKSTPVIDNNHNPNWNYLYTSYDFNGGDKIAFDCYDKDITTSDFIGKGEITLARGAAFTGTVNLNTQGYLNIQASWQSCSGDCQDKLITMAQLADMVYSFGQQADNWHLIQKSDIKATTKDIGKDHMALYKKKGTKECALSFSGSNDVGDWLQNFNAFGKSNVCGYSKVHSGFLDEVSNYFKSPGMVGFSEIIADMCGGQVFSVGHSLGGAVASITAGCLNSPGGAKAIPKVASGVIPFKASGIYTIGAPAVSKPAMTNTGGTCFAGRRDFNYDAYTIDPVPLVAGVAGYLMPEVDAMEMHANSGDQISQKTWKCNTIQAEEYPYGLPARSPSIGDHGTGTYIKRLKDLFR
jgi:hypothetical protein